MSEKISLDSSEALNLHLLECAIKNNNHISDLLSIKY